MKRQLIVRGVAWGWAVAAILGIIMTSLDWRANPDGVFRGSAGTRWGAVWETFVSWTGPAMLLTVPLAIGLLWLLSKRKRARSG